jgi:hypothetical protein
MKKGTIIKSNGVACVVIKDCPSSQGFLSVVFPNGELRLVKRDNIEVVNEAK